MKRLALLLALVGCGTSYEGGECNTPADVEGWVTGKYQPPATPIAYEPLPASGGGFTVSELRFDPSVPRSVNTVWWSGADDLALRWELSLARNDNRLRDARMVMTIDGVQRPFVDASGAHGSLPLQIAAGAAGSFEARIAADDVAPGAHTWALAAIDVATGNSWAGVMITIVRDGDARFTARPDHGALAKTEPGDGWSFASSAGKPIYVNKPIESVTADGTMPVSFVLQPADGSACEGDLVPMVVSAFVDFEQRPLEGFGPFARVLLDPTRSATVDTRVLAMPPPDGRKHVVTFLYQQGDGSYGESPVGSFAGSLSGPSTLAWGFY